MLSALIRQEVKVADKTAEQQDRRPGGSWLYSTAWWSCLLAIIVGTTLLRNYNIGNPQAITWDESHFLRFSQHYLNGTYFQDVHPPLGKMIVGAIGYLAGQNRTMAISHDNVYQYPQDEWYILMRIGMSLFGVFQVVTSFLIVWEISQSLSAAYITSLLIICDTAAHAYNRLVLLDPILLWFILLSAYSGVKFWACRHRAFSGGWWLWMSATGVSLGLTMAVKYVGAFVVALIGLQTVYDLWEQYCDQSSSLFNFVKHLLARCLGLIVVPILLYLSTFALHLHVLDKGANSPGIGFNSAEFRLSFPDHAIAENTPPVVAYGSHVTLRSAASSIGYLSTSYDLYPPEFHAEHQVVSLEMNLDELNAWGFKRPDEAHLADFTLEGYVPQPVLHGDLVRLINIYTERHLHTHRIPAPITRHMHMACGFGEPDEYHAGGVWRVLLDDPAAEQGLTPLKTVSSRLRLVSNRTGCALRPGLSKYPEWGYHAWEVVCDPKGVNLMDTEQLFQIDENVNPRMKGENIKELYQLSTVEKIVELHQVMFTTNNRLTFYEFEGEEAAQKLLSTQAWMWPVLYRGCPGHASSIHSLYFIGSPHVYLLNFIVLCVLPVICVFLGVQRARQSQRTYDTRISEGVLFLLVGWALHYLPFWTMRRMLYFHHYLPAFFFSTMLTGVVLDAAIGRLERLSVSMCRDLVRPSALAVFTAFYVNSFIINWELAYGVPGDESGGFGIKKYLYVDTWQM